MPPHLDLHRSVGRTDSRTVSAIAPKHKLCSKDELVLSRPDGSSPEVLARAGVSQQREPAATGQNLFVGRRGADFDNGATSNSDELDALSARLGSRVCHRTVCTLGRSTRADGPIPGRSARLPGRSREIRRDLREYEYTTPGNLTLGSPRVIPVVEGRAG